MKYRNNRKVKDYIVWYIFKGHCMLLFTTCFFFNEIYEHTGLCDYSEKFIKMIFAIMAIQ